MLLILSTEAEKGVNRVIDWLLFLEIDFIRINDTDHVHIDSLTINNAGQPDICISVNGESICTSNITHVWYRKGNLHTRLPEWIGRRIDLPELRQKVVNFLLAEWRIIEDFIFQQLENKKVLGNFFHRFPNKLTHLLIAKSCGLEIPVTLISGSRQPVEDFQTGTESITKSIDNAFTESADDFFYFNYTEPAGKELTANMGRTSFPSLFQQKIEKAYEVRVVFIYEKLYAMAIFSQNDHQTKSDYRNYNKQKPNRRVPYLLPDAIAQNLRNFISKAGLNTGAIDLIVTPDKKYVFLEANPNGQFGDVSENCNYYLEKEIASCFL